MPYPHISLSLVAALLATGAVAAHDLVPGLLDQLRAQGFGSFEVSQTLLGRTRIVATGPGGMREIVFNPATGEIVRDYTAEAQQDDAVSRADEGADAGNGS